MARQSPVVAATPWDALLLLGSPANPAETLIDPARVRTVQACLVITGKRCTSRPDIYAAHGFSGPRNGEPPQVLPGSRLAQHVADCVALGEHEQYVVIGALRVLQDDLQRWDKLYQAARYQRRRGSPEELARRAAWEAANKEQRVAYAKAWREANRERIAEQKAAWAVRKRLADPEAERARSRECSRRWYEAHREEQAAKAAARSRLLWAQARGEVGTPEEQAAARERLERKRVNARAARERRLAEDPTAREREQANGRKYYAANPEKHRADSKARSAARRAEVKAAKEAAKAREQAELQARIEARQVHSHTIDAQTRIAVHMEEQPCA